MNIRSPIVTLVCAFLIAVLAAPALAAGQPAPRQGWGDAVERLAAQAAQVPPGIRLESVVVAEIREGRTQARWPLSDALERDLAQALARRNPPFAVVGEPAAPGRAAAAGASGSRALSPGRSYAMLTGTFTRSAGGDVRIDLLVRDLASQATLYRLAAATVAATDLPSGAAPGAGFGKLVLTVEPATAQVFVDGRPVGRAPLALTLPAGPHALTVAAEGFDVYDEPVDLEAEAAKALTVRLKRPSFTLSIESNVPGAITRIDGKERGAARSRLPGRGTRDPRGRRSSAPGSASTCLTTTSTGSTGRSRRAAGSPGNPRDRSWAGSRSSPAAWCCGRNSRCRSWC